MQMLLEDMHFQYNPVHSIPYIYSFSVHCRASSTCDGKSHLVVLDKVLWLAGNGGVGVHHILVHHGLGAEQGETSGTDGCWRVQLKRRILPAENTAKHVLCCLLKPVSNGILKLLVPDK